MYTITILNMSHWWFPHTNIGPYIYGKITQEYPRISQNTQEQPHITQEYPQRTCEYP